MHVFASSLRRHGVRLPASSLAAASVRGIGQMGSPNAFSAAGGSGGGGGRSGAGASSEHELRLLSQGDAHIAVTCTRDPAVIDAWLEAHVLRGMHLGAGAGAGAGGSGELACQPLGIDCEFQPRFIRGSAAPPLACLQLATRDAVLVAQVLGLAPPASGGGGGGGGRAGNNTPPQLPRALAQIFASPAARRLILPVGVGVREDVTKLLDALGLRGEAGGASAPVGVRELAAAELLACLPAGAAVDGAAVRIAPLPLSSAVACCNLGELNSWLGLGRGAGHSAGLESLARQLLGFPRWKRRSVTMSAWETWPLDRAQQLYAALDAVASLRVFDFLAAAMAQTGGTKPVSQPQLYAPAVGEHEGGGV